jgi:hypothetical protein
MLFTVQSATPEKRVTSKVAVTFSLKREQITLNQAFIQKHKFKEGDKILIAYQDQQIWLIKTRKDDPQGMPLQVSYKILSVKFKAAAMLKMGLKSDTSVVCDCADVFITKSFKHEQEELTYKEVYLLTPIADGDGKEA